MSAPDWGNSIHFTISGRDIIEEPLAFLLRGVNCVMKILVQNCLTHLYLKTTSEWTDVPSEAKRFASTETAMMFCLQHNLPAVHIVLKFEPDRYDMTIPVSEECEQISGSQKALLN
jgi:hypothetical protein